MARLRSRGVRRRANCSSVPRQIEPGQVDHFGEKSTDFLKIKMTCAEALRLVPFAHWILIWIYIWILWWFRLNQASFKQW
jgi:hypothetical protein